MELLKVRDLSFTYPGAAEKSLDNISLSIEKGGFYLLCGYTGSGKTTLLRMLKPEKTPFGEKSGEIIYSDAFGKKPSPFDIGFVAQDPDEQIAADKVSGELAFGLENMGLSQMEIHLKTGEAASYFGIADKFNRTAASLSGGEKQLLALAGAVVTNPKLLILDEPTSQLDPITAVNFIETVKRLNRDFGITVILAEHRLEDIFSLSGRVIAMDKGRLIACDTPKAVCEKLKDSRLFMGFPSSARIWREINTRLPCPINVKEGKAYIKEILGDEIIEYVPEKTEKNDSPEALRVKGVWFRYEKDLPDVLKDFSLTVKKGEIFGILGSNGVGKTTLLSVLSGLIRPYKGKIKIFGRDIKDYKRGSLYKNCVSLLPQDTKTVFIKSSVKEDFEDILMNSGCKKDEAAKKALEIAESFNISGLLKKNPYDLSGGERQKCALIKLLLTGPEIIMLDEPTKGLDAYSKAELKEILNRLKDEGKTVIIVTHDIEFAADVSSRNALLFDGELISDGEPGEFFASNIFYTTAARRIAGDSVKNAVRNAEVSQAVNGFINKNYG
ncbi:MAG: ATP-binding cassette domain-containing protein [Oscillospiraceae bacterium]|nr:ATP-binding cassette domain-containing protein [Oscillospiraceae bacterium]